MTKNEALELALAQFAKFDLVMKRSQSTDDVIAAIMQALDTPQVLPDVLTQEYGDSPDYVDGWNECREVMAGMMK
jgi:hypothetical protein